MLEISVETIRSSAAVIIIVIRGEAGETSVLLETAVF
jgi:hypothetical protein